MSFVIDGSDWLFDGLSTVELEVAVTALIERIERVNVRGETLWFGHDFHTRPMLAQRSLWQLFDADQEPFICREIQNELAAQINHLNCYEDQPELWPSHFEELIPVSIGEEVAAENIDVLWAHLSMLEGRPTGCLGHARAGRINTRSQRGAIALHWLGDATCQAQFWRDAIELEGDNSRTLQRLAPHAYPNLYFAASLWKACNDFKGGYFSQSSELRRYLEAFDDFGNWIFTASPDEGLVASSPGVQAALAVEGAPALPFPSDQLIIRRFAHLQLDVAPEKPNVRKDKTAREAREIEIGTKVLYCQWHGKLQAHQNRVHIHRPVLESGNKLVVAIFTSHLPLPGE